MENEGIIAMGNEIYCPPLPITILWNKCQETDSKQPLGKINFIILFFFVTVVFLCQYVDIMCSSISSFVYILTFSIFYHIINKIISPKFKGIEVRKTNSLGLKKSLRKSLNFDIIWVSPKCTLKSQSACFF